ncbi:MAG: tetratricopeptide repeat protein [Gammaproteobacteria bacterium]|nr:tetratricopeptide repeat protein [Gammaproteobacteria bacterium]
MTTIVLNTGIRRLNTYRKRCVVLFLLCTVLVTGCSLKSQNELVYKEKQLNQDVFELSRQADQAYRESRWLDAARMYQSLTEKVPQDAYSWFRLGNTYAHQGAYNQAIHAYEVSLEKNSAQPKSWFNLSTAYLLKTQHALNQAWNQLRADDPARILIEQQLALLQQLMHQRLEDTSLQAQY